MKNEHQADSRNGPQEPKPDTSSPPLAPSPAPPAFPDLRALELAAIKTQAGLHRELAQANNRVAGLMDLYLESQAEIAKLRVAPEAGRTTRADVVPIGRGGSNAR